MPQVGLATSLLALAAFARNPTRSIRPELFVTVSLCTHLGCIPTYAPEPGSVGGGWPGGFYCPCHGSKFDLAGRVYKGSPAPTNLVIPPHQIGGGSVLVIGIDAKENHGMNPMAHVSPGRVNACSFHGLLNRR